MEQIIEIKKQGNNKMIRKIKMLMIITIMGSLMFGHGSHRHSHGTYKHAHSHNNHGHHHNHNHHNHGHHNHNAWKALLGIHLVYDVFHHHNHKSSRYWKNKYMDVRSDLKLLWEDFEMLQLDYDYLLDENLRLKRKLRELESDRMERLN